MGRAIQRRLLDDAGTTPALFDADQFVTASTQVPSNWRASIDDGRYFELAPASWLQAEFWEEYFNQESAALAVFEAEKEIMMAEDSRDSASGSVPTADQAVEDAGNGGEWGQAAHGG